MNNGWIGYEYESSKRGDRRSPRTFCKFKICRANHLRPIITGIEDVFAKAQRRQGVGGNTKTLEKIFHFSYPNFAPLRLCERYSEL